MKSKIKNLVKNRVFIVVYSLFLLLAFDVTIAQEKQKDTKLNEINAKLEKTTQKSLSNLPIKKSIIELKTIKSKIKILIKNPWLINIAQGVLVAIIVSFILLPIRYFRNRKKKKREKKTDEKLDHIIKKLGIVKMSPEESSDAFDKDVADYIEKEKKSLKEEKDKADSLYNNQQYEKALIHYQNILNKVKSYPIYFYLGNTFFFINRYEEALNAYDKAIKLKPDYAEAWYNKGVVLSSLGQKKEALNAYDKAIKLKPDFVEAWNNKGIALANLGKNEEALKALNEAIKLKPDDAKAWNNKGNSLSDLGQKKEALNAYDEAIKLKPDFAEAWNNKGVAFYALGQKKEALNAYDKAIKLKSDYAEAWNNKGVALYKLGKKKEALNAYDEAIKLKPDYADGWYNKGIVLSSLGQKKEAQKCFDKAKELALKRP